MTKKNNFANELMSVLSSVRFGNESLFETSFTPNLEDLKKTGKVTEEIKETEEGTYKTLTYEANDGSEKITYRSFESRNDMDKKDIQKLLDDAVEAQDYESAIKYRDMLNS